MGFTQMFSSYSVTQLQQEPLLLQVPTLTQSRGTSCGEAVIVMAYNYAHPQTPLHEADVIAYAAENGFFTESEEPFTSPFNMANIVRNYTFGYSVGTVSNADQSLTLLIRELKNGNPVIVDVLTHFDDPQSSAHFVWSPASLLTKTMQTQLRSSTTIRSQAQASPLPGAAMWAFGTPGKITPTPAAPAGGW